MCFLFLANRQTSLTDSLTGHHKFLSLEGLSVDARNMPMRTQVATHALASVCTTKSRSAKEGRRSVSLPQNV